MVVAFFLSAALASTPCVPVDGSKSMFERPRTQVIWFGETHGTREAPAIFGDLVCAASATGRPVIVALERGKSEQGLWDAFLNSDGGPDAEAKLLSGDDWMQKNQDGRNSHAILDFARSLRRLKAEGRDVSVRLIMPDWKDDMTSERYEGEMALAVSEAAKIAPKALVLAYSGSTHAAKRDWTFNGARYRAAAAQLSLTAVLSVNIQSGPGLAWTCKPDEGCGPHAIAPDALTGHSRGVVIGGAPRGFDAVAYTGTGTTASPPATRPGS